MKKLYAWLVIRAFKIKEPIKEEFLELKHYKQKRNQALIRNFAIVLALASIVLLVIPFFVPGLKTHHKFSRDFNTAYIMNTCSGCLLGICFLILISLVSLKNSEENHNLVLGEKVANKET